MAAPLFGIIGGTIALYSLLRLVLWALPSRVGPEPARIALATVVAVTLAAVGSRYGFADGTASVSLSAVAAAYYLPAVLAMTIEFVRLGRRARPKRPTVDR